MQTHDLTIDKKLLNRIYIGFKTKNTVLKKKIAILKFVSIRYNDIRNREQEELSVRAKNYFRVSSGKKVIGGGLRAIIWLLRGVRGGGSRHDDAKTANLLRGSLQARKLSFTSS